MNKTPIMNETYTLFCTVVTYWLMLYAPALLSSVHAPSLCSRPQLNTPLCAVQVWALNTTDDLLKHPEQVTWTVCTMTANFAICFLGWWRCFANNYLHWAAGTTWLLLIAQGTVSLCVFLIISCLFPVISSLASFSCFYFPILFLLSLALSCFISPFLLYLFL